MAVSLVDAGGRHIPATPHHPQGILRAGGYDPAGKTLFLGPGGHPDGMAKAGDTPDPKTSCGITVFESQNDVWWANDAQSLPRRLTESQTSAVQKTLQDAFVGKIVIQLENLGKLPP